ncbi:MAG: MFS transporter, partial [Pseudomonadota bacterium]
MQSRPVTSRPRAALWALSLAMFAVGTASLIVLGAGQEMTDDLGVAPGSAGWLMTTFAATFALAAPLAQWLLAGQWPQSRIVLAGLLLLAGSLFWAALAQSFGILILTRAFAAMGGAMIAPTSAALAVTLVPADHRARALATVFAGFTLASVLGVPLGTWLSLSLGWRGAMAAIGCVALIA